MSFDDDYYVGHLQPLLTDEELYNVDPYLFSLREKTAVNTAINSEKYFKSIKNITFRSDSKTEVLERARQDINTFNMTNATPVNQSVNVGTFQPLNGAATEEFASIVIEYNPTNISPTECLDVMKSKISVPANLEKSHNLMHTFLKEIVTSVGRYQFNSVLQIFRSDTSIVSSRDKNYWNEARYLMAYLPMSRIDSLVENVMDVSNNVLCGMVKAKIQANLAFNNKSTTTQEQRKYILTNLMEDLQIDKFKGPLYYNLRTEIVNQLKLPTTILNSDVESIQLYFKQLAADIYIKTCYPSIIFDYIDCMMNLYIEYGDFVNSRIALLAKVMFTYYFFLNISTAYGQDRSLISNAITTNNIAVYNQMIESYLSKIQFYLQNINNIDLNANNNNMMKTIVKDLHQKSSQVADKSKEIQLLKDQIKTNQLAYRNVIYNTDVSKKFYKAKITENIILIVILLVLIVVCSALLFLNNDDNKLNLYVTYISGGAALIILMYQIFKMVSKLVRK